jgi:hypothetical protein
VTTLTEIGGATLAAVLLAMGAVALRAGSWRTRGVGESNVPKAHWTMPPAALLSRPRFSARRHAAMLALGGYMVVALVMLIVKSVSLAGG